MKFFWPKFLANPFKVFAFSIAILLAATQTASAMRVTPMVAEITTSGSGSVARIEVGNAGSALMPFEAIMTKIEVDEHGVITETPADENFLVFPPQGLVPVNGRQVVRVQWVGPAIESSEAYYLSVRQLPVDTDPNEDSSGPSIRVNILYTMKALIVVAPPGTQPEVSVANVKPALIMVPQEPTAEIPEPADVEKHGIELTVTNSGNRYALMSGATWLVEATDTQGNAFSRTYSGSEISQSLGVGYLPAVNGRRTFKLVTDVALDEKHPISVRFTR